MIYLKPGKITQLHRGQGEVRHLMKNHVRFRKHIWLLEKCLSKL